MNTTAYYSKSGTGFQPSSTAERVLAALASYDLKPEHEAGKYRCNSPLRPGSNSHAFTLIIHDGEHGAYMDHVSEDSGTLYELAAHLGIDLPASPRQSIASTKRVYSGLGDYAQAHGVGVEIFKAAGWSETTYQDRPALAFTTQTGSRHRFLDGDKPTYKSPMGYERCWYGLKRAVQLATETQQPLVICNGEASTVAAQHYSLAACAVTGGEPATLPPALLAELQASYSGDICIAFDCLDKGVEAAPVLAEQLRSSGYNARAVDLRLSKGGDVADFCHLHGAETVIDFAKLPNLPMVSTAQAKSSTAPTTIPTPFAFIHNSQLDSLPPVAWLLSDLLPREGVSLLTGPSGSGKSFLALDIAAAIAQNGTVIYMPNEGYKGYAERKIAWCTHFKRDIPGLYFGSSEQAVSLVNPLQVQGFIDSILPLKPDLVIFDTLAGCIVEGDENSATSMQTMINHCRRIAHTTGAAVLLVHHPGKNNDTERGSSAILSGVDMALKLSMSDGVLSLSCKKAKDAEPFATRRFGLIRVPTREDRTSCVLVPSSKIDWKKSKLAENQRLVLESLALSLFEDGATFTQLVDATGLGKSSVYYSLGKLKDRLYVLQDGATYRFTAAGRTALAEANGESSGSTASSESLYDGLNWHIPTATPANPQNVAGTSLSNVVQVSSTQVQPIELNSNHPVDPGVQFSSTPSQGGTLNTDDELIFSESNLSAPMASVVSDTSETCLSSLPTCSEPTATAAQPTRIATHPTVSLPSTPDLSEAEHALLQTWAAVTGNAPREYLPLHRVFDTRTAPDLTATLRSLCAKGCLEAQPTRRNTYRLTERSWGMLGKRLIHIDLRKY